MHRFRPRALFGLIASLTLVLAACGGGTATSDATDDGGAAPTSEATEAAGGESENTVSLAGGRFAPTSLTIPVGTTVTFTNSSGHTVTEGTDGEPVADPFVDESGSSDPIEVTFDEAGTFNITCTIHPAMNMTITVEG